MISAELLITFTLLLTSCREQSSRRRLFGPSRYVVVHSLSVNVKKLPNKLFKGVIPPSKEYDPPPPFKMTRQICRITVFGGHFCLCVAFSSYVPYQ